MKKIIIIFITLILTIGLFSCKKDTNDIVILYTNDIHCGIDSELTLSKLKSYEKEMLSITPYVSLVDSGDLIEGTSIGKISEGQAMIDIANKLGIDVMTFGNHEFDYGIERLDYLTKQFNGTYVNANIRYNGSNKEIFTEVEPYTIIKYGKTKVAFIGITTPLTLTSTRPSNLMENETTVIDFYFNDAKENFYSNVQKIIDKTIKKEHADYVIALSHLGNEDGCFANSIDLARNTTGLDVIIDAHDHIKSESVIETNPKNENVIITSTGTKLESFGKLTINNNIITTTLIESVDSDDEEMKAFIEKESNTYLEKLKEVIFTNDVQLNTFDENNIRLIRNRETNLGDLFADAIRNYTGSDISIINGGGFKANLNVGEVSYNTIINVSPYGNNVSMIEMTGSQISDYLEFVYSKVTNVQNDGEKPINEFSSFMQVSGLKVTIDTSKTATIELNENDKLLSVSGERRITSLQIMNKDGIYEDIDLNKTYKVGGIDYVLTEGGSGTEVFLKDNKVILDAICSDYVCYAAYIVNYLKCDLSAYKTVDNRIIIK